MDLTLYEYIFEKAGEQIKGYAISKFNKILNYYICVQWDYQNPV